MRNIHKQAHILLALPALVILAVTAFAADPGIPISDISATNDQIPGSVLFYNFYTSSATAPTQENTRISITNVCSTSVTVHLFFVDGSTCSAADSFINLTGNQTVSFLASDVDPGVTGYIVAVAVDPITGCPIDRDCLVGYIAAKGPPSEGGDLCADICGAMINIPPMPPCVDCNSNSTIATLVFDGLCYSRLPRTLAVSSIPDRASGNNTLLIINRIGGNLATGAAPIGSIFGLLFDDTEKPFSFSFSSQRCQFISSLSNNFPRTVPRFETVIPAGQSGWMKFWSPSDDAGLLGAVFNRNPNAQTVAGAFNGGRNLHILTLSPRVTLTIPVFPPGG
jgi:hypothetical protein